MWFNFPREMIREQPAENPIITLGKKKETQKGCCLVS